MHAQNAQRLLPAPRQPLALLYPARESTAVRLVCRAQDGNSRVTWTDRPLSELAGRVGRYQIVQDDVGCEAQAWAFQDGSTLVKDNLGLYSAYRPGVDAGLTVLASE